MGNTARCISKYPRAIGETIEHTFTARRGSAAAAALLMANMGGTARAQEVANGSSGLVAPLTQYGLDARVMGDNVPPQAELDAAFGCTQPTADPAAKKTVVLVPGVGLSVEATYAWGYIPQLSAQGYDVCWVQPPHSGRGDLTQTALYVANGIKLAHQRLDKKVAAIGHSAGSPAIMWALRYDTEAASLVDDFISVAGANRGTDLVEPACKAVGNCPVIAWQMHPNSDFVQALHAKPLPDSIDVTSVYRLTDEGIQPATQVSSIASAANIAVQDVCPTHLVGHVGILGSNPDRGIPCRARRAALRLPATAAELRPG